MPNFKDSSLITFDQITHQAAVTNTGQTSRHSVQNSDQILIALVLNDFSGENISSVAFNGTGLQRITTSNAANNAGVYAYVMFNPPVGQYDATTVFTNASGNRTLWLTLGGVNKSSTNIKSLAAAAGVTSSTGSIQVTAPNTLLIDFIELVTNSPTPDASQTNISVKCSFKVVQPGVQTMSQTYSTDAGNYLVIALEPAQANSYWNSYLEPRNLNDVIHPGDLMTSTDISKGYIPKLLWKNSFLHTVGRIMNNNRSPYPDDKSINRQLNIGSPIIVDNITLKNSSASPFTFDHLVKSSDVVLVVMARGNNVVINSVTFNGTNMTQVVSAANGAQVAAAFIMFNPPVGVYPITVNTNSGTSNGAIALSLLGVDKKTTNIVSASNTGTSLSPNLTITPASANNLILDFIGDNNATYGDSNSPQTRYISSAGSLRGSLLYSQAVQQSLGWTVSSGSPFWAYIAIALEPNNAASISRPNINLRNNFDVINTNGLDSGDNSGSDIFASFGQAPANFYKNSFLHTIGRILSPVQITGTVVSETEQETSQIIVDKIFQGQTAAVPVSTVTLNMNVSIPSQEAVLVVTGGSVIATGAKWANVQLNGTALINLVQTAVAGADAEIWWMPNPPVGTYTLTVTSGTGGEIYANAMVLLGVDKRSTNIGVASATDAASSATIGALITPDSPNSLIIDTLATLNATTFPVQDASQTQVFNATALASNEYVLSSYKIASAQQNMNYNLSAAVNAALVAVTFRPAQAASIWFPNIDFRQLDDTVTAAGLDSEINPAFGSYGYKPTTFWQNSFLHTVGRTRPPPASAISPDMWQPNTEEPYPDNYGIVNY